ncbi:MAG: four helix bundle protein [Bacteroidales bacterium]|nr:four helix bundle protein [Bacteroidales bacterium]
MTEKIKYFQDLRIWQIALGSCAELETQIIIANELDYINETNKTELIEKNKIYLSNDSKINK